MGALYSVEMPKPKQLERLAGFAMLALLLVVTVAFSIPAWREAIRDRFLSDSRQVLAKVDGDLNGQGDFISVVKVKTRDDLIVEVYTLNPQKDETSLRARLILPESKDGFFQFRGRPTNLALVDMDGDNWLEIIAPTFDENLIPRLHVYHYDPHAQIFVPMGPESITEPR